MKFFIDPSSNKSEIELGTLQFPYRSLDDPFREIFNNQQNQYLSADIFIKMGGNATIYSNYQPIIIYHSSINLA